MYTGIFVDGKNIAFKSQYGTVVRDSRGQEAQCVYGFLNYMRTLASYSPSSTITVLFDGANNWRKGLSDDYKGTRDRTEKEVHARSEMDRQIPFIKIALTALGIDWIVNDSAEADDLAGYYSRLCANSKAKTLMVTRDKDWIQCLNPYVDMLDPVTNQFFLVENIEDDFGVNSVHQFLDYKALKGDAGDNLPPTGGLGEVKAKELLRLYGSVDNFLAANITEFPNKAAADFHSNEVKQNRFYKNKVLMDLTTDVTPLGLGLHRNVIDERGKGAFNKDSSFMILTACDYTQATDNFKAWIEPFEDRVKDMGLLEELQKEFGDNDKNSGDEIFLNTGYAAFNKKMSGSYTGGYAQGKMHGLVGASQTGKTIMASMAMVEAQKAGGVAVFIDFEKAFQLELSEVFGLNVERPYFIYKQPETFEEGEAYLRNIGKVIRESGEIAEDAPVFIVVDSLAAAIPASKLEKALSGEKLNMKDNLALAQATSNSFPLTAAMCSKYNITALYLNQLRESPDAFKGSYAAGGKAWTYYLSTITELRRHNNIEGKGVKKDFLEQDILMETIKTRFTKPFQTGMWRLKFDDKGICYFDTTTSMVMHMSDENKVITRSGAWYNYGEHKAQGMDKFVALIEKKDLMPQMIEELIAE